MKLKDIKNITIEQAMEVYRTLGISFIIKDGKLKGLSN